MPRLYGPEHTSLNFREHLGEGTVLTAPLIQDAVVKERGYADCFVLTSRKTARVAIRVQTDGTSPRALPEEANERNNENNHSH